MQKFVDMFADGLTKENIETFEDPQRLGVD